VILGHETAARSSYLRKLARSATDSPLSVTSTRASQVPAIARGYRRLARRRGRANALVATGNTQLEASQLLADPGMRYHDLGADYYERQRDIRRQISRHADKLGALGFDVTLCRRPEPNLSRSISYRHLRRPPRRRASRLKDRQLYRQPRSVIPEGRSGPSWRLFA